MSTSTCDVLNPATEEIIRTIPLATLEETDQAIEKAAKAFGVPFHPPIVQ